MVFANISIKGWIIDPYVQSLFNCSHKVLALLPCNIDIVDDNIMTSDVNMVKYWRWGLQIFFEPFSKSS